jgi:hypothetical protein
MTAIAVDAVVGDLQASFAKAFAAGIRWERGCTSTARVRPWISTKDSNSRFDGDAANAGPPHFPADRGAEDLRQLECRRHP